MFLQGQGWIMDIIRSLIANIDTVLFTVVRFILVIIFDMANYEMPFDRLQGIYDRMFVLISVFMVFKLSFTFFQYLMNPDRMSDNKTGLPKLFRNTMIMIVLMIFLPMLFTGRIGGSGDKSFVIRLQNAAIPTLTRVLLGTDGVGAGQSGQQTSQNTIDTSSELANEITLAVAKAFIHHSIEAERICNFSRGDYPLNSIEEIPVVATQDCRVSGSGWFGSNLFGDDVYIYSYTYLLPAVVAVILGFILLRMALSVGKRVFKLMILEIITPIPVMSLINPQALDKGDSPFMAWLHSFISTFLEIFFQLAILYLFIIFIDVIITDSTYSFANATDVVDLARKAFVSVALVLSLLFFAGEAPGFLKKALGIKDSGDEMGAIMGAGIGAAVGGAQGFMQGLRHGSPLQGAIQGGRAGAQNGSKAKNVAESLANMHAGGDAAAQLITGNKNYRTGALAGLGRSAARWKGMNANNLWRMGRQKAFLQEEASEAATAASNAAIDLDKFKATYDKGFTGTCNFTGQDGSTYSGSYDMLLQQLSDNKTAAESRKATADSDLSKVEADEKNLKAKMEANGLNTNVQSWQRRSGETRNNLIYSARKSIANTKWGRAAIDTAIARNGTKVANRPEVSTGAYGYEYNSGHPPDRI